MKGYSLAEASKLVKKKHKFKVPSYKIIVLEQAISEIAE